jgi:hypothetical protein
MIHIEIPHKTFNLYKNGVRTFIHLPTEDGERLKLTYGEIIVLVNKETKEELEQVFWFHYKLKSIPRFQFLVFEWDKKNSHILPKENPRIASWKRISLDPKQRTYLR